MPALRRLRHRIIYGEIIYGEIIYGEIRTHMRTRASMPVGDIYQ